MTNREWLNSLSNEALADLLKESDCICCIGCDDEEEDEETNRKWLSLSDEDFADLLKEPDCFGKSCRDGFIEWLKKEHKEDGEANKEAD
jgi:hypothetical protein